MNYIIPILFFLLLGAAAGIVLTIAGKKFYVEPNKKVEEILEILPGINCGACGFSGCEGYAAAIEKGSTFPNLCKPGGKEAAEKISKLMGVETPDFRREIAVVHCNGNCEATEDKFVFEGPKNCASVNRFYCGKGSCEFGCLGYGDCVDVCEFDAIKIENGVAVVHTALCTACGKCIKACPKNLIRFRYEDQKTVVLCSSKDVGKVTRTVCKNGCIACRICEKKCPHDAIHVIDNRAVIDSSKCTNCGVCITVCPSKCIVSAEARCL